MIFTQVPQDYILREWPRVHPMLKKATDITNGRADVWEIFDALISGEAQLWIVFDDKTPIAAITTKVKQYNGFKALFIDFVGGSRMNEWLKDVLVDPEAVCKRQRMRSTGRVWSHWLEESVI
jgi:hypothetical protein